jgi:tetratricopeptide (TPR) repeat protein
MKFLFVTLTLCAAYVYGIWEYGGIKTTSVEKLKQQYHFEKKSIELAKENRLLKAEISNLKYEISQLESKNRYLTASREGKFEGQGSSSRSIASIPKKSTNELVAYEVYKWAPEKLLAIGEKELHFKNYEKSAQFYAELIERFPQHQLVTDRVLFGAGVASFETGKRFDKAEEYLARLVKEYPKSEFYRGAKLWMALAQYNQGENEKFFATVEEFRLKYRNTEEWKILSRYYEDISYKIKK